jgi:asparagine synthase (glutamine-hydrolysing)
MCGIAGIVSFRGRALDQLPRVVSMGNAMRHRGPDDEGYLTVMQNGFCQHYFGPETPTDVRRTYPGARRVMDGFQTETVVALGHRRLSILDLSAAGHQPMSYAEERFWLVYNGEIYNHLELRTELIKRGYAFRSKTDTEVILASYAEWGERCLRRFNGDFAFALWDNKTSSLFCARDRIGIKPFYYECNADRLIFASDIQTLIASGLFRPKPDRDGLYLAMAFGIAPRPLTAFQNVQALEQSHWMRVGIAGHIEKQRYWRIPIGSQDKRMQERDAVALLDEELTLAVRRRLVADVPVGTFMSGGIDSTTVSAIAARFHPGIRAFTLGYEGAGANMDEIPQAEATARMSPMRHIVKRVKPEECLQDLPTWIAGYEEPFYSLPANYMISKLARDNGVTVILNGLGGDELFGGYSYYRHARLALLRRLAGAGPVADLPGRLKTLIAAIGRNAGDHLHTNLFCLNSDAELGALFRPEARPSYRIADKLHALYCDGLIFTSTIEALSYMDLMNYVGNHHVHRTDQFTMCFSLESRFPLLDHELVEAAFRIPDKWKVRRGMGKYVLRRVARDKIHQSCLAMKKKGFGLPLRQWMQGPFSEVVRRSIWQLRERPEVCGETVSEWYRRYEAGGFSAERIWHLTALELWFEHFIDQRGRTIAQGA